MTASPKWLIRTLWTTAIAFSCFVCIVALTNKSQRKRVTEDAAEHQDWKHFAAWRTTDDFTNSRTTLLKINEGAKGRDFTDIEIQALIRAMQSTQGYVREMSLAISQREMSEQSKISLKSSVVRLIQDELPSVRQEAVVALYFVGSGADVTNLDSAISDSDPAVASAANRIRLKLSQR